MQVTKNDAGAGPCLSCRARVLADRHGGPGGAHPFYDVPAWQARVRDGATRLGYWDWVVTMAEADGGAHG